VSEALNRSLPKARRCTESVGLQQNSNTSMKVPNAQEQEAFASPAKAIDKNALKI